MRNLAFVGAVVALLALPAWTQAAIITVLDLTSSYPLSLTGTGVTGGTFIVQNTIIQPTGTGRIDGFLRIQQNGQERGYNTGAGTPLNDKPGTRALQLSEIPIVTIGGTKYREFLLDVNQTNNGTISLNQIQLFQSSTDVGMSYSLLEADATHDAVISFTGLTPVFEMNNRTPNTEIWSDSIHGSGSGDMFLYVQNSLFNTGISFVTLFSQFGTPPGSFSSNDGFDEWAVLVGGPNRGDIIPEPGTLVIWGLGGLCAAAGAALRRRRTQRTATRARWSGETRNAILAVIHADRE
jgi:hypothetical protein